MCGRSSPTCEFEAICIGFFENLLMSFSVNGEFLFVCLFVCLLFCFIFLPSVDQLLCDSHFDTGKCIVPFDSSINFRLMMMIMMMSCKLHCAVISCWQRENNEIIYLTTDTSFLCTILHPQSQSLPLIHIQFSNVIAVSIYFIFKCSFDISIWMYGQLDSLHVYMEKL